MRLMYDSVNPDAIPTSAAMVAGYVSPSGFAWDAAGWARFPSAVEVRITPQVSHTAYGIHVLDVEKGDATPAQAPGWAHAQRALSTPQDPTIYCSAAVWASVQAAFQAAGEPQPHYWVAAYPGTGQNLPTLNGVQAVAHQFAGSSTSGGNYDLSVVADYWPGVDNIMAVLQPDDYVNIANAVLQASLQAFSSQPTPAKVGDALINAYGSAVQSDIAPGGDTYPNRFAALDAAVAAIQAPTLTLSADQLASIEQSVSMAVKGLNLSVSAADQAAIAAAVAALLGAKLSA